MSLITSRSIKIRLVQTKPLVGTLTQKITVRNKLMTQSDSPLSRIELETQNNTTPKTTTSTPTLDEYHGDDIHIPPKDKSTRIYFQNINGARTYGQWDTWHRSIRKLKKFHINICGIAETNIEWNQKSKEKAKSYIRQTFNINQFTTSNSTDSGTTDYQPGGTALIITDNWTGSIKNNITDTSGIGRWSGFRIQGKNNTHISIFCGYHPTKGTGNTLATNNKSTYTNTWEYPNRNHEVYGTTI